MLDFPFNTTHTFLAGVRLHLTYIDQSSNHLLPWLRVILVVRVIEKTKLRTSGSNT